MLENGLIGKARENNMMYKINWMKGVGSVALAVVSSPGGT